MIGPWSQDLGSLAAAFAVARPFSHVVIDDFLDESVAAALLDEFPAIESMPKSHDYIFGDKRELPDLGAGGEASRALRDYLLSEDFAGVLEAITGRALFVDPGFHGGGFHQGADGSFLDTHVDFNVHPHHDDWLRVLNILLYLNRDWEPEYGGALLVRSDPSDEPLAIDPRFNRCVMMLTGDATYHGYRRMSLPPGVTRKSVAAYAYELVPKGSLKTRTTSWVPEGGGRAKVALARQWTTLASARDRLARRRR